jgi:translation elongation factor EF-1alpha
LIVVLNKIDLIPENDRQTAIIKKIEALKKVFSKTKFHDKMHFVPISANVGKL